jgi:hypothetical protein
LKLQQHSNSMNTEEIRKIPLTGFENYLKLSTERKNTLKWW